jgi:protein-tyrosine phosphatase
MTSTPRWLPLDGAANARDLGGLPTESGAPVHPHRLLRADNLQGLTPEDVRLLVDEVGLRTVIDLRTNVEVALEGPGPLTREPAVTIRHLSLFAESGGLTDVDADADLPWATSRGAEPAGSGSTGPAGAGSTGPAGAGSGEPGGAGAGSGPAGAGSGEPAGAGTGSEPARTGPAGPSVADALVTGSEVGGIVPDPGNRSVAFYLAYLRDRPDSIVAALRAVADTDGAALVHCAAGKDRTGVVVALALSVAGVPRDRIVADYVATADRLPELLARLRASDTYRDDLDSRPDDAHRPRPETMELFLRHLDEHSGGPVGWLASAGFGPADVARLRSRLAPSAVAVQD